MSSLGDTPDATVMETACRRFEQAWREGRPEAIEACLPPVEHLGYLATLEELVCIEMELSWKARARDSAVPVRPVEDYLTRFPALRETAIAARIVRYEYHVRQCYGDRPTTSEYRERFGDLFPPGFSWDDTLAPEDRAERAVPRIPGYEVQQLLGRGGMGAVYLARDIRLDRLVAVKVLLPGPGADVRALARFRTEASVAAGLQHPNIVQVFEVGEDPDAPYSVQEYLDGGSLAQRVGDKPQAPDEAAALVETLARAIDHAHRHGVVHRDLKPSNILFTADGTPKIGDFGLAKRLEGDSGQTQTGDVVGTPSYMAPEQAGAQRGSIGPATDVYGLGAVLYHLLTGRPPFRGLTTLDTLSLVVSQEPVAPRRLSPAVPRDLETICLKCLAKQPARRYPSAAALAEDLRRFLAGEPIHARPVGVVGRSILWCRRKPALTVTIALALAAITLVAAVGFYRVLQERERYRQERDQAQANLYRALVGEARAVMQGRDTGWWWKTMDNIREAAALEVAERNRGELRELAIECVGGKYPCLRVRGTCEGHSGLVASVAIRSDGAMAASGSRDRTIRLWSVPDGQPLAVLSGHSGTVTAVAFHPAGRWLASGSADGSVRLWDMEVLGSTEAKVFDWKAGAINAVAFAPDGAFLAAACQDGDIHVLAMDRGGVGGNGGHTVLSARAGAVTCLAFSSTGRLASGSANRTIRLWDVATARQIEYWGLVNAPNALAFSPEGTMFAWSEPEVFGVHLRATQTNLSFANAQIHSGAVRQVCYDSRGRLLTASADGTLKLWLMGKGGRLEEAAVGRGAWGDVLAAAVHSGGRWVVSGHANGRVRLWELAEPPQRALVEAGRMQQAAFVGGGRRMVNDRCVHDFSRGWEGAAQAFPVEGIAALAVHPAGRRFAYGGEKGSLALGDIERPGVTVSCVGHGEAISALAGSPDGKHLASASADGTVRLWNWETGKLNRTCEAGFGALHAIAWTADSRSLAVTAERGVAVWNVDGPPPGRVLVRHTLQTGSVAVFADLVAFSGPDGVVEVRELLSGRKRHTLRGHTAVVRALEFSHDGSLLASGASDGSVRLWQVSTGSEAGVFQPPALKASFLAFDPQGRYLASDSSQACLVWDIRSKAPVAQFHCLGARGRFAADGSGILIGTGAGSVLFCPTADIERARTAARGSTQSSSSDFVPVELRRTFVAGGHTGTVWGVAASPDGRWIATAGHDRTVKLWDARTLKLVRTLEGHQSLVWCVAFSPDSNYLATGSARGDRGAVTVWDVATGRAHRQFQGHRGLVLGLAFHPNGSRLASSSLDGSVRLWDVDTGEDLGLLHQFDRAVYSVAFRPDGRWLAASCLDNRIAVWELADLPSRAQPPSCFLEGHTAAVYAVGFSGDGRWLASGSEQGVIMLWDAQTFAPIVTLRGGTGQVRSVAFSPDGELLAGAAYVAPTIVWDLDLLRRTLAAMGLDW